ncbi:MAG: hypothetical protein ACD_79C00287G0025 [uncultured bacterium]|nr:MAG: hypothetical protein ACD_79C00287G0025 [uncultured bacterium]
MNCKKLYSQETIDKFLICPDCKKENSIQIIDSLYKCKFCSFEGISKFDIPVLIRKSDYSIYCQSFLGTKYEAPQNPYKGWRWNRFREIAGAELLHFFNVVYFMTKFGVRKILNKYCYESLNSYCDEVEKALFYGWKNYFNLILKSSECYAFNRMLKYINDISIEIGCSNNKTTNMIFKGNKILNFGCEYFINTFLTGKDLNNELFNTTERYLGLSINSVPFRSESVNSVVLVHIVDHIPDLQIWFKEIHRILQKNGHIVFTTYSKYVFDNMISVKLIGKISKKLANLYKEKISSKVTPRGGIPLKSKNNFYCTGQNLFSLAEWKQIANEHGFEVEDHYYFGKYFSHFMDIEYRGYYNSALFNHLLYSCISEMILDEKKHPIKEEDATNLILVLKKI